MSTTCRAKLIRYVIQGIMIYFITTYSWTSSLIKELEAWFKNFLWYEDINKRNLVTVAWNKVCRPAFEED